MAKFLRLHTQLGLPFSTIYTGALPTVSLFRIGESPTGWADRTCRAWLPSQIADSQASELLTSPTGASVVLGCTNSWLLKPSEKVGDGIMGVLGMSGLHPGGACLHKSAAGLGLLACSLLLPFVRALRKSGRRKGIDAAMRPVCCST